MYVFLNLYKGRSDMKIQNFSTFWGPILQAGIRIQTKSADPI